VAYADGRGSPQRVHAMSIRPTLGNKSAGSTTMAEHHRLLGGWLSSPCGSANLRIDADTLMLLTRFRVHIEEELNLSFGDWH
jgi:hypothetical protein